MANLIRFYAALAAKLAAGAALPAAGVDMRPYAGGLVTIPNGWTAANMGFQHASTQDGTYTILRDAYGTPVQITGIKTDGARSYALPDECFGAFFIKPWSKSATPATETGVNQISEMALELCLKG